MKRTGSRDSNKRSRPVATTATFVKRERRYFSTIAQRTQYPTC